MLCTIQTGIILIVKFTTDKNFLIFESIYEHSTVKFICLSYDPEDIRQGFIAADHNHDGNLTLQEVLEIFKKNDFNGNHLILLSKSQKMLLNEKLLKQWSSKVKKKARRLHMRKLSFHTLCFVYMGHHRSYNN